MYCDSCVLWHYSSITLCAVTSVPCGCALWVSLKIPSPMPHEPSGPSFVKEENMTRKYSSAAAFYPDKGISQSALEEDTWHEVVMVQAVSSATHLQEQELVHTSQSFLQDTSQEWGGYHVFPALPGRSTLNFHPSSLRQGYPQLSFKSRCLLLSGFPVAQNSVANVSTLPVRIAAEASFLLQAHLPEKH